MKIILHVPSQPFFHILSLMNLDIVILGYGHYLSSYVVVKELKSYTILHLEL